MEEKIKGALCAIIHPETGEDIVKSGFVEQISVNKEKIVVSLHFTKARDPFAVKIKNQVEDTLRAQFPTKNILVVVKEGRAVAHVDTKQQTTTDKISKVIAIASGKGGVGKSTVTANLAVTLRNMGFRVGVLDADIYGPSQPKMFGVEDYIPEAVRKEGVDMIIPAEVMGIKIISIGFFVKLTDALLWRGAMATNALKQLIHQTQWGALDFLLVDLPPGTGDIHLSIIHELKIDAAVIVSTPQKVAVADVVRGVELFSNKNVNIPIAGIIENMAWFSPEELPENRYYLFGRGGVRRFAEQSGVDFLGEIPIVQSIMESSDEGNPAVGVNEKAEKWYREIAQKIVDTVSKGC
jgi:ATP-binding protein involved in chromosome partitioning